MTISETLELFLIFRAVWRFDSHIKLKISCIFLFFKCFCEIKSKSNLKKKKKYARNASMWFIEFQISILLFPLIKSALKHFIHWFLYLFIYRNLYVNIIADFLRSCGVKFNIIIKSSLRGHDRLLLPNTIPVLQLFRTLRSWCLIITRDEFHG